MRWKSLSGALTACAVALTATVTGVVGGTPIAHAKNGDTHITGQGIVQTIDCNNATLLVDGVGNYITAVGTCWGVTMQGSSNTVIADTVINDITVYGWDQTALFHNGEPALNDIGRQLGMVNRLDRVPA
jgi:hypothetical protein